MKERVADERQGVDRPDVHSERLGPDQYEQDLVRDNKGQDPRDRRGVGD